MVKKDRQQNYYTLAYPKNNDTKILPESFTKIPDAISVFGNDSFAILDAVRKTSEIRAAVPSISLSNYSRKSAT